MRLSLVYMTGRADPRLDWLVDTLATQMQASDEIELVVIDALGRTLPDLLDREKILRIQTGLLTAKISPPKPTIWQGPHRVTSTQWWATSNSRNTAICLAAHDYLAFCDDRCYLGRDWLATVRAAESARASVIAGSYDKHEAAGVSTDHRRGIAPGGKINCGGGWLYGCTFALPLEWALEVNGCEEGCDGLTGEDYIFGLMLGNRGRRIDFVPALFVEQHRAKGNETCKGTYACRDKGISPNDKSHAALARFGVSNRTEFTPDLRALRAHVQAGGAFPIPDPAFDHRDWYDGELVREMKPA